MKRHASIAVLALAVLFAAGAEVEFLSLDLGKDDGLLFTARADLPGDGSFDSLFFSTLGSGKVSPLTAYPENIALVEGGKRLQVQNRFGLFRTDAKLAGLAPVEGYAAFANGDGVPTGRLPESAPSPDGAWVLAMERVSPAYCRLVLVDSASGKRTIVSEAVEAEVEYFPARWSPDSRYFIYAKAGAVFYYSIDQLSGGRLLDEDYRRIGPGKIRSVRWGKDSSLFYLRDSSLYRILPAEFFPQALYRGLAGMGALAGNTPFPYDPSFDDFWVSTEGSRIVLTKGGRNLFLLYLDPDDIKTAKKVAALPYLLLQGGMRVRDVLWPARGPVTVFADTLQGTGRSPGAYRFDAPADPTELDLAPAVRELDVANARQLVISPDETLVAVVTRNGVTVRNYADWKQVAAVAAPDALHALWPDSSSLVVATSRLIEKVALDGSARTLIGLSQVDAYGRNESGAVIARSGDRVFALAGTGAGDWKSAPSFQAKAALTNSESYRVYLEASPADSGPYRNQVMVRSIKAFGTKPILPPPALAYAPFPERDEPRTGGSFDHGSRIRRREVAITFDALDSAEGLTPVLNTLKDYGVTATFFVNGEFVRRSPQAARILAASGHETGSMFFTTVDPTDARFSADRDYIRRGLARAEDEWFAATGRELALLWHTPYYSANDDIIAAGATMNYVCTGRDIDPLDWVSLRDGARLPGSYLEAHAIVERIVSRVKPGSIVPIRLGAPPGGRDDYLFLELALLINALEEKGYSIVPVSTLIEHAR